MSQEAPIRPQGMRPLTDAEREVNEVWAWDDEKQTYVCDSYPNGIEQQEEA